MEIQHLKANLKTRWLLFLHVPGWTWFLRTLLLLIIFMVFAIILPVFASARYAAETTQAREKAQLINDGLMIYMGDSETFPPISSGAQVTPLISPYFGQATSLSTDRPAQEDLITAAQSYDWNRLLSKIKVGDVAAPSATWVFKSPVKTEYHLRVAGYVDGRARWTNDYVIDRLIADPSKSPPSEP